MPSDVTSDLEFYLNVKDMLKWQENIDRVFNQNVVASPFMRCPCCGNEQLKSLAILRPQASGYVTALLAKFESDFLYPKPGHFQCMICQVVFDPCFIVAIN